MRDEEHDQAVISRKAQLIEVGVMSPNAIRFHARNMQSFKISPSNFVNQLRCRNDPIHENKVDKTVLTMQVKVNLLSQVSFSLALLEKKGEYHPAANQISKRSLVRSLPPIYLVWIHQSRRLLELKELTFYHFSSIPPSQKSFRTPIHLKRKNAKDHHLNPPPQQVRATNSSFQPLHHQILTVAVLGVKICGQESYLPPYGQQDCIENESLLFIFEVEFF